MITQKIIFLRGGRREPKEGVTMSHASQAPFHEVGGLYIHTLFDSKRETHMYIDRHMHEIILDHTN